ncbi:MAG: hypothetical protein HY531_02850 [Chloroflexi bacterium]|nr:hypothetical protein [Chloroflexota bacterium]
MYKAVEAPELFARQLGIKAGFLVEVINAPPEFVAGLEQGMPPGARVADSQIASASSKLMVCWPRDMSDLMSIVMRRLKNATIPLNALWAVIPKKPVAERRGSDLFFQAVLDHVLPTGLVDNKSLTFSEEEYGIRFVPRRAKNVGAQGLAPLPKEEGSV